jgi:hypothetical protein
MMQYTYVQYVRLDTNVKGTVLHLTFFLVITTKLGIVVIRAGSFSLLHKIVLARLLVLYNLSVE